MKTRVAAVQMEGRVADLRFNLDQVSRLLDAAIESGATVIAIPEFFTTPIIYDPRLFACALPPENPAIELLRSKSRRHGVYIGGSYLEMRDGDVYNTYVFVEPDGTVHRHDKDIPTMVEGAFYIGGTDPGRMETSLCSVGAAVCWEMVRTQTVQRLRGQVDLLMTGSHWWSDPGWRLPSRLVFAENKRNRRLLQETPGRFAELIGAPTLHAGHVGVLSGRFLTIPKTRLTVAARTRLLGETQIIDGDGTMVARLRAEDGPGVVTGDITLGRRTGDLPPVPQRFWIPELGGLVRLLWHHQNACGRGAYRWAKRTGRLACLRPAGRCDR